MSDANKLMFVVGQTPVLVPYGSRDLRRLNSSRRNPIKPAAWLSGSEGEELHTMSDPAHGPARGIVLALVPGLLIWAGLVDLAVRVLR